MSLSLSLSQSHTIEYWENWCGKCQTHCHSICFGVRFYYWSKTFPCIQKQNRRSIDLKMNAPLFILFSHIYIESMCDIKCSSYVFSFFLFFSHFHIIIFLFFSFLLLLSFWFDLIGNASCVCTMCVCELYIFYINVFDDWICNTVFTSKGLFSNWITSVIDIISSTKYVWRWLNESKIPCIKV